MNDNFIPAAREVLAIEAETLQKASEALDSYNFV